MRRASTHRWLDLIGWQGVTLVVVMALINALRRSVFSLVAEKAIGPFVQPFVTGLIIGFAMLIAVVVVLDRFPVRGARRYLAVATAVVVASAFAAFVKTLWDRRIEDAATFDLLNVFVGDWMRYAVPGLLIGGAYLYLRAEAEAAAVARDCDIDAQRMAREVAEARLRVLEAQIEPHFLFNTLASVKRLYRQGSTVGDAMLDNLMRYLSVTLPQMRSPERTLGGEAALATAYLDIQRVRMGRRMSFDMRIPESLRDAAFPPFMLLTLVENAVKHGLDPLPQGGSIFVQAAARDDKLIVEVRDTGRGFSETSGAGTGLAGIRARLRLLYGDGADLDLRADDPPGVVATLVLPLEPERARQTA